MNFFKEIPPLGIIIWLLASLFFLYEFFLRTFVGTIAKQFIPDLHLNAISFSLIISAYYLTYSLMQMPVGILIDKFGLKKILIFSVLTCAFSTFIFSHSTNFITAFFGRILMGFGSSFAFISILVVAITWFPKKYFGFFLGLSQLIGVIGPIIAAGPLASVLHECNGNWRLILIKIGLFGLILAASIILIVKEKPRDPENSLIYLQKPESLFLNIKTLITNRQVWWIAIYSATVYISITFLGEMWGNTYLETRGLSQVTAANMISLTWLGYALACLTLAILSDVIKRRNPILFSCATLGLITTTYIIYIPITYPFIYGFLFFCVGVAAAGQTVAFSSISEQVSKTTRAAALGLNNSAIALFATFTPLILSYLIDSSMQSHANSKFQVSDFTLAFSLIPFFYLLAMFITFFLIEETYCRSKKSLILLQPTFRG